MKWWQYILFPFSIIYGSILWLRRKFYLIGIFKRKKGTIPSIIVGNLQVGGSGKTPMTIWLAEQLQDFWEIAVLSRGYGRNTKGFLEVTKDKSAAECGDEPVEMRGALPDSIRNFVCENRVEGLADIAKTDASISLGILDDAYQHLLLKGDFYLLLTEYNKLFTADWPMPSGRLREFPSAAKDASAIVVTKCPQDMDTAKGLELYGKLMHYGKPVFFAAYDNSVPENSKGEKLSEKSEVVLVSGLANNEGFKAWAGKNYTITESFFYRDHKMFTAEDVQLWAKAVARANAKGILTSRKDYMRMKNLTGFTIPVYCTFTQPTFLFDGDESLLELIKKSLHI